MIEIPEWPCFLGNPAAVGIIRSCPGDFFVEEIPRIHPEGEGSHLWLWVEKCSANTDWVAKQLARAVNCAQRDVGFAGLKDRHAITRQWFSLPVTSATSKDLENINIEGVTILESCRHGRKLKRGTLEGNRFQLKIRDFKGDTAQTDERLEQVRVFGVPNYFGPQRFGHRGQNVTQGFNLLEKNARLKRNKKSIYLSAIRSFLFNQVLAERVRRGLWNRIIAGDLAMLDGSQSIFPCNTPDADIEERCKRLDIHPTGPMPGKGGKQPTGDLADVEREVLGSWPELVKVLISQGVQASRRALRVVPRELEWNFQGSSMELSFVLPPGTYATTVLREVLVVSEAKRIPGHV